MDQTVIDKLVHRVPFRPFTLLMNDGRGFYIRHPELISVAPTHVYLIDDKSEQGIYLSSALIASLQADDEKFATGV